MENLPILIANATGTYSNTNSNATGTYGQSFVTGRRVNANTVNNRTVVTTHATFPRHNFNGNPVGLLVHFTKTPHGALLTQQATLMVMLPDSNSYRNIRQPHILMEPMTTRTSK